MNKAKILVMYASEYDIKGEDGRQVSGCTLNYYFFGEHGEALKPMTETTGAVGYQRAKCSIPYEKRSKVSHVPAIYEAELEMSVGSDGRPVMRLIDVNYLADIKVDIYQAK